MNTQNQQELREKLRKQIDQKFKEIDEKLKQKNLTESQRQALLEERAGYEDDCEELDTY